MVKVRTMRIRRFSLVAVWANLITWFLKMKNLYQRDNKECEKDLVPPCIF